MLQNGFGPAADGEGIDLGEDVLDDEGRPDRQWLPIYDGTMGDCDDIFFVLYAYLAALGVHEAKQVIFVADGAKWIWQRTLWLWAAVGLAPEKVVEVVDWYHAVETLHTLAKACRWAESRRKAVSAASTPSFGGERGRADWGAWRVR